MLSSSSPADVRRGVQSRNQNPGIVKNMNAVQGIERNRYVDPVPHSAEPSLTSPPRKKLGRLGTGEAEDSCSVGDANDISGVAQHASKASARVR